MAQITVKNYFEELGIPNEEKAIIIKETRNLIKTNNDLFLGPKIIIDEKDSLKLNLTLETKKVLAERIRDYVLLYFPKAFEFDRFDEEWNILFKLSGYEIARREAIRFLEQNWEYCSYYLGDYKLLIVACEFGLIIGQISEVEPEDTDEAALMVNSLYNQYGHIRGEFRQIKDLYLKDNDLPYN